MLMLNRPSSTFFLWPIWLFIVVDMVFSCGRCRCGRYGTDPLIARYGCLTLFKIIESGTSRQPVYDFLYVFIGNLGHMSCTTRKTQVKNISVPCIAFNVYKMP